MNHYVELTLIPNLETPLFYLWQKLYQQIHIALADNKEDGGLSAIGLSFPEYDATEFSLGTKLRLLAADEGILEKLNIGKWLARLSDYVHISSIRPVPASVAGYACFNQVKIKGNRENLARRRAKRSGESFEQSLAHFNDYQQERSKLPYIQMQSVTNGHRFRLFIDKIDAEEPTLGPFSCYGLSRTTTVPLF
ncbi:MAG: type I-F CRISPR-associated endoribonuclease Cas6/Csy4 [Gammaproteobacteria bacterium]|nr:type I-F CRISPR-associated endoribonuclease Cas6/Csy4 [Gammaproteobacteria bacterium]